MEKINIYVPKRTGIMLENDAEMFEVYKKDGRTINKNRFLTMLIVGYYEDYAIEAKAAYDAIMGEFKNIKISSNEKHDIANSILNSVVLPHVPPRKGKNPNRLSLKPTKDSAAMIEHILQGLTADDSISQYFCRMFMSYCEKPFSKREQIIFKDSYETLKVACNTKQTIMFRTIWNNKVIHEVAPYKVVAGPEEMFNYLLCAEYNEQLGKQVTKAYRLNRIDKISYGRNMYYLDDSVKQHLLQMLHYGPQYMINDDVESCVRLSASGVRNFSRIYYGRPIVDRVEEGKDGSYYYFKCSMDQVFMYFRRFGYEDAEIISPNPLRERMIAFHEKAYSMYKGGASNG